MRKILAMILTLAMVLSLAPMAFADDEPIINVKLDEQAGTFSDVKEVAVEIENVSEETVSGDVTIAAPEGWTLKDTKGSYKAEPGEKVLVKFGVTKTTKTAFNIYCFDVTVTSGSKSLFDGNLPLGFLSAVKAEKEIDIHNNKGDISDWADAYPVYVNAHTVKDSKNLTAWRSADVAAQCFMKWDDNYLYILVNDYDDVYVQEQTAGSVWSNDNVQVSIDTLNEKTSGSYGPNDYEYGISFTPKCETEVFTWHAPEGKESDQYPSELGSVYRDDDLCLTRYFLKLDKEYSGPLPLKQDTKFGVNFVINDADATSRESAPQLTSGTADGKSPSKYKTFTMVAAETANSIDEVESLNLPIDLTLDWENSFKEYIELHKEEPAPSPTQAPTPRPRDPKFSDVTEHWARNDIEAMASAGVINGYEDGTFKPDNNITRIEFLALLTKTEELSTYNNAASDVSADFWGATYVQTGIDKGIIPAEMYADGNFYPDQLINREEMACMIVNAYKAKSGSELEAGESTFADESEFSGWTKAGINAAAKAQIVNGKGDNRFEAKDNATRAEAATIVKRLLDKI